MNFRQDAFLTRRVRGKQPGEEKGPLSLEDIRAWLDKTMAGLIEYCGFPLGTNTFRESFQLRFLGSSGEQCFYVDLQG